MSQPQIGTNGYDQLHKLHLWKQEKMLKFQKQNFKVFENHRKCHIWDFQTSIDSMDKDNYGWTSLIQWTKIMMDELHSSLLVDMVIKMLSNCLRHFWWFWTTVTVCNVNHVLRRRKNALNFKFTITHQSKNDVGCMFG